MITKWKSKRMQASERSVYIKQPMLKVQTQSQLY